MKRSLTMLFAAIMSALILPSISSCGEATSTDPIDAIPAGTRQVAVMDLDKIAAANGAERLSGKDGLLPAAEDALRMFLPTDLLRPLAAVLSNGATGIDTSDMVIFTTAKGYTGLILKTTDHHSLTETLLPYRDERSDFGDYQAYTTGKRLIAVSENLCVIAPDAETVKSVGQTKGGLLVSEMPGVRNFLKSDNAIRSARVASDIFGKKMDGLWLCVSMRFSDSAVIADLSAIHPDGQPDSIGARMAGEIDTDVLGFVPVGSSLVIASGLQGDDAKLFGIEDLVKSYFPGDIVMSKSGTTLWYARPAGTITSDNLLSPDVWNFAGIIQMPETDGNQAVINMQNMTRGLGRLDPATGCYTLTDGDNSITYGYVGGCFVQSANGPVVLDNVSPVIQDFQGARVAAMIDIPGEGTLRTAAGLPCGASLAVKVTTDNIHAKLSFYGNRRPLLSTIESVYALKNILPFIIGMK